MLALFASLLFTGAPEEPASVAMVVRIQGAVALTRPGGQAARAWTMDLLRPGDRLTVPDGGAAHVFFMEDGHKEVLAAGKTATVQASGCTPPPAVARKLPSRLGKAALKNLKEDLQAGRLGGVLLRGPDDPLPPVLTPLPGANILSARPTLSWPAAKGATGYVVELFTGPDTKDLQKVWRLETKDHQLPFPAKQPDLQSVTYRWSVVARSKEDDFKEIVSLRQATFSVATRRERRLLEEAKKLGSSDDPADVLLAIGLYESRAVHDEALKLYEKLVKQTPEQARFHEALARYYEAGGRPELAKPERDTAARLRKNAAEK